MDVDTNDDCDLEPKGLELAMPKPKTFGKTIYKMGNIAMKSEGDLTGKLSIPFGQVRFHIISITIDNINFTVALRFISVTNNVIYAGGKKPKKGKESERANEQKMASKRTSNKPQLDE